MPARILIATFVLLIPLAGVAQTQESGWISDARTGCRVSNPHPQPNEAISWSGGCTSGLAEGQGVLQWFESGHPAERYEGEMHGGQMSGHGILRTDNGGRYEGDFRDGVANGFGEWTSSGSSFSGTWTNGCFHEGTKRAWVGGDPSLCP